MLVADRGSYQADCDVKFYSHYSDTVYRLGLPDPLTHPLMLQWRVVCPRWRTRRLQLCST